MSPHRRGRRNSAQAAGRQPIPAGPPGSGHPRTGRKPTARTRGLGRAAADRRWRTGILRRRPAGRKADQAAAPIRRGIHHHRHEGSLALPPGRGICAHASGKQGASARRPPGTRLSKHSCGRDRSPATRDGSGRPKPASPSGNCSARRAPAIVDPGTTAAWEAEFDRLTAGDGKGWMTLVDRLAAETARAVEGIGKEEKHALDGLDRGSAKPRQTGTGGGRAGNGSASEKQLALIRKLARERGEDAARRPARRDERKGGLGRDRQADGRQAVRAGPARAGTRRRRRAG